jgi:hypothetical protein
MDGVAASDVGLSCVMAMPLSGLWHEEENNAFIALHN